MSPKPLLILYDMLAIATGTFVLSAFLVGSVWFHYAQVCPDSGLWRLCGVLMRWLCLLRHLFDFFLCGSAQACQFPLTQETGR